MVTLNVTVILCVAERKPQNHSRPSTVVIHLMPKCNFFAVPALLTLRGIVHFSDKRPSLEHEDNVFKFRFPFVS